MVSGLDTPADAHAARLLAFIGQVAELQLEEGTLLVVPGALLSFENDQTIFFGQVESIQPAAGTGLGPRVRLRVEQFIDRDKIRSIQQMWNAEPGG